MKKSSYFRRSGLLLWMLTATITAYAGFEGRIRVYHPYSDPAETAQLLKTSSYSNYQYPTGFYFEKGEEIIVEARKVGTKKVSLKVTNFGKGGGESVYQLKEGLNKFIAGNRGNCYLTYYGESSLGEIVIDIQTGKENGYFDAEKDNNQVWTSLLTHAKSDIMDIVGRRIQLAYDVESLKRECPNEGIELTALYDSIITIQHEIMGLNKYNKVPKNKIFGRVIWEGFMHADGLGAAFHVSTMNTLANPASLRKNCWGVAHEFGHVNQVRPDMKWVGTTEVTNNIYSVWTQYLFNPTEPKFEREHHTSYDKPVICGRINSYMESAYIKKQEWLTQAGPDDWKRWHEDGKYWHGDHFVKLIPLWQLQLYFAVAGKGNSWYTPDLYADVFHQAIESKEHYTNGQHQLNFMKRVCQITKTDLTDFFVRAGMLVEIDKFIGDYPSEQLTITAEEVADLKRYASRFKKPAQALSYISANSIEAFNKMRPIKGKFNQGIIVQNETLLIDHREWKYVTAFETYCGNELIKVAVVGTGSNDNSSTLVQYPKQATRIEAIAWDGKKTLVYGKRG